MVEQPEILKYDTDTPPHACERVLAQGGDIVAEQCDQPTRRPQRQEQEAQKRALAGA